MAAFDFLDAYVGGGLWSLIQRLGTETHVPSLASLGSGVVLAGTYPTGQVYKSTPTLLGHARAPSSPLAAGRVSNVAIGTTVGGLVRTSVRGDDRRHLELRWRWVVPTHLLGFLSWWAIYGAMRRPFLVELPANLTDLAGGSTLRVRARGDQLQYRYVVADRYEVEVELIEDLT